MTLRFRILGMMLIGALMLPAGVAGQTTATIRPSPEAPLRPLQRSQAELDDYLEIEDTGDPATRLRRVESFKGQFNDSEFRHLILLAEWEARLELGRDSSEIVRVALDGIEAQDHFLTSKLGFASDLDPSRLEDLPALRYTLEEREAGYYRSIVNAYNTEGDFERVAEYGEMALEAMDSAWELFQPVAEEGSDTYEQMRLQDESGRLFVLHTLMAGFQSAGDAAKTVETGEAILEVSPLDLQTLMTTSLLMLQQPSEEEPAGYLQRAEGYAEEAVRQTDVFLSGPDASDLSDEERSGLQAEVDLTLADINYQMEDWAAAASAYRASAEAVPDGAVYFMLGLSSYNNRNLEDTLSAFARAVYLEYSDPQARSNLETLFEAVNGSVDGLDDFVQAEGEQIAN